MKKLIYILLLDIFFFVILLFYLWNNYTLGVSFCDYTDKNLPDAADGIVVAHVSDVHDSVLIPKLSKTIACHKPDVIVVTGDLADRHLHQHSEAMNLLKSLSDTAPTYYVLGNHEFSIEDLQSYRNLVSDSGAKLLENQSVQLFGITWLGINDRHFWQGIKTPEHTERIIHDFLCQTVETDEYTVLLAHRPRMTTYDQTGVSLAFCGHHHGGLWRFPGIPGIIAPDDGFFPEYTAGFYKGQSITLYISRGIGNSGMSFRLFNRPDVSFITFHKK